MHSWHQSQTAEAPALSIRKFFSVINSSSTASEGESTRINRRSFNKKEKRREKKGKKRPQKKPMHESQCNVMGLRSFRQMVMGPCQSPFPGPHHTLHPSSKVQRGTGEWRRRRAEAAQWERGIREELLDFDASRQRRRAELSWAEGVAIIDEAQQHFAAGKACLFSS